MSKTVLTEGDEGVLLIVKDAKPRSTPDRVAQRSPIHVVYGGAHLFKAETPAKLGSRALASLDEYAPNFVEFAQAMTLPDTASLPRVSRG